MSKGKKNRDQGLIFENRIVKMFMRFFRSYGKKGVAYRLAAPPFVETPGDVFVESKDCKKMFFIVECKSRSISFNDSEKLERYINMNELLQKSQIEKMMIFSEYSGRIPLYAVELRSVQNEAFLIPLDTLLLHYKIDNKFNPTDFIEYKLLTIYRGRNIYYVLYDDVIDSIFNR